MQQCYWGAAAGHDWDEFVRWRDTRGGQPMGGPYREAWGKLVHEVVGHMPFFILRRYCGIN